VPGAGTTWLLALGILAVAFSVYAAWLLRRKLRR
jgi:hypothetical protein